MNMHLVFRIYQKTRGRNVICGKEKKLEKDQLHFCLQICSSGLQPIPIHITDKPIPTDCFIQASTSSDLWLSLASGSCQLETRRQFVVQRWGPCQFLSRPWVWPQQHLSPSYGSSFHGTVHPLQFHFSPGSSHCSYSFLQKALASWFW